MRVCDPAIPFLKTYSVRISIHSQTWVGMLPTAANTKISIFTEGQTQTGCCAVFSAASDFTFATRHTHHRASLLLWLSLFILSGAISLLFLSSILDTVQPVRLTVQCHVFSPFHTVCGVLKAGMLEWFATPFSSGPRFVRTLHHDPSVVGDPGPCIASLSSPRLWSMWSSCFWWSWFLFWRLWDCSSCFFCLPTDGWR